MFGKNKSFPPGCTQGVFIAPEHYSVQFLPPPHEYHMIQVCLKQLEASNNQLREIQRELEKNNEQVRQTMTSMLTLLSKEAAPNTFTCKDE